MLHRAHFFVAISHVIRIPLLDEKNDAYSIGRMIINLLSLAGEDGSTMVDFHWVSFVMHCIEFFDIFFPESERVWYPSAGSFAFRAVQYLTYKDGP